MKQAEYYEEDQQAHRKSTGNDPCKGLMPKGRKEHVDCKKIRRYFCGKQRAYL